MTAIEMPLLRQAIADAFAILLLFVLGCYLIHRAVQRFRQLWRQHQLALAFDTSRDRKLLLRRSLQSLAETPGIQIVRKTPSEKPLTRRFLTSLTPSTPGFAG